MSPYTNLFFATGRCFVCHVATHPTEACSKQGYNILFCKRLDDPHHESSASLTVASIDNMMQSGTPVVLVLMQHGLRRPSSILMKLREMSQGGERIDVLLLPYVAGLFPRMMSVKPSGWHPTVGCLLVILLCKRTSIHFLTSPILSHSPPVHMYSPSSPLHYLQGPYLKLATSRPDGPMTFQKSTH
jgi:hypothetical protein